MQYLLISSLFITLYFDPGCASILKQESNTYENTQLERKLTEIEVKKRGFDLLVTKTVKKAEDINLKEMARSAIFETSYGFRWKMINTVSSKIVIFKVDKKFHLISIKYSLDS